MTYADRHNLRQDVLMSPVAPPKPQTAAQIATEARQIAQEAMTISAENNRLLKELHAGLMQPLPGYHKSFVQRATEVVVEAEAGKIVGEKLVFWAKVCAALGAMAALIGFSNGGPKP